MNDKNVKIFMLIGPSGEFFESRIPGKFGGHRRNKIYGKLDCRAALQAIARGGYIRHRIFFLDEQTAISAGYRPCAVCMHREYVRWKQKRSI